MSYAEKTNVEVPRRNMAGEPTAPVKEESAEKSPGLPRDTDNDEVVDAIQRDRLQEELSAVGWRSEFYNSIEQYSISSAYRYLSASKQINSPFFVELKKEFLDFLDECERRGMARLTKAHVAWLGCLRADVTAERFESPRLMINQLGQFIAGVGKEDRRKQMAELEAAAPGIKRQILLNAFWGGLRRGGIEDFIGALYQLKQAKEWQMPEYAGMRREFLHVLDEELARPFDEQKEKLRKEMKRMKALVTAW